MLIYRVEHEKTRVGPFHGKREFLETFVDYNYMPTPYMEGIEMDWLFDRIGCQSMYHLYKWFHSDAVLDYLHRHGYCIRVYEIDSEDVKIGRSQVAFYFAGAEIVETKDVYSLVKRHDLCYS